MKNTKSIINTGLFLMVIMIAFVTSASAQQERKYIRKGNDYFEKALGDSGYVDTIRMQKAELQYRKVLDKDINSYEGGFNLGASLYKQKKFADAAEQYKILASKENDKTKLAKVYHNLGNSMMMDGKLEESIEAYKNGLRNNPSDTATKFNLAVAQKLKNEAEQQEQQQEQNQDQNQDQDQDQEQDKKDQEKQEQQEQKDQEKKDEQKEQEQQQAEENEDEKGEEEKKAMKEDQISKEDAERLLQALQQEEKELQEKLKLKKKNAKKIMIEKDW